MWIDHAAEVHRLALLEVFWIWKPGSSDLDRESVGHLWSSPSTGAETSVFSPEHLYSLKNHRWFWCMQGIVLLPLLCVMRS